MVIAVDAAAGFRDTSTKTTVSSSSTMTHA